MRPVILVGALFVALVASRGAAQGAAAQQEGKSSDPHPAAQEDGGKDIKGYGYGEQPGKSDTAAKQEAGSDREASTAPQDERRSSGAQARSSESATGHDARSVMGRVVKAGSKSLSIQGDDQRVSLRIDAKTRLLRDGKAVPVRSLRAGEEVRAAYDDRGGQRVATTITLVQKGASEPPSHTDQGRESDRRQEGTQPAR